MKKKRALIAAAVASCITLSATFTGCSLVSLNSKADMEQVVADIVISNSDKFEASLEPYKTAPTASTVTKRELVSYFLNAGYSQVQNGSSYEDTFNNLMDALVNNAVLVQYSTMRLLEAKAKEDNKTPAEVVAEFTDSNKTEWEKYEYLLGGKDGKDAVYARYRLYSSINSAIDNYERTLVDEEDEYEGTETRTTPVNLDTENDEYYPKKEDGTLNYGVYTGYGKYLLADSGIYKDESALDGTTRATRKRAYNNFVNSLRRNELIEDGEDLTDVLELKYVKSEYVSQLESRVINKYYDMYEKEKEEQLLADEKAYVQSLYNEMSTLQSDAYSTNSAFESAMSSMSSSSFILYSPSTEESDEYTVYGANGGEKTHGRFGFVYNILLPFSAKQSAQLSELTAIKNADGKENDYYYARNQLLQEVKTTDQRAAWFNGKTDYSFDASSSDTKYSGGKYGASNYLFFENNLTDSGEDGRYKKLQAYDGRYSYNGKVYKNEDGSYTLLGNSLDIDDMLSEFTAYVNYVLSDGAAEPENKVNFNNGYQLGERNSAFYDVKKFDTKVPADGGDNEIDYAHFVYASGKVQLGEFNKADLFNSESVSYKAMSAVNELQFAYTTDTSVLSQYAGYSVSAYETSYIKEFEYACHEAVANGEGSFTVCAGDYGWHLAYVTYTFDVEGGKVYGEEPDWNNIEKEGTFENLFYEWVKSTSIANVATTQRDRIIKDFNKDSTVTKYQKRYQDLLDLDNN